MYRVYANPPAPQIVLGDNCGAASVADPVMLTNATGAPHPQTAGAHTTSDVPQAPPIAGVYQQSERMNRDKRSKSSFIVHPVIENFLRWQPVCDPWIKATNNGGKQYWQLRTECSIVPVDAEAQKPITLRCHPNFQNEGPWYDWAIVKFETDRFFHHQNNKRQFKTKQKNRHPDLEKEFDPIQNEPQHPDCCVPCKILAFAENTDGAIMALVHGCRFRTTHQQTMNDTVLLEFWQLEYHNLRDELPPDLSKQNKRRQRQQDYFAPFLSWIDVRSILRRCLVIEEEPGIHEQKPMSKAKKNKAKPKELNWVMLVRDHSLWPEQFT